MDTVSIYKYLYIFEGGGGGLHNGTVDYSYSL